MVSCLSHFGFYAIHIFIKMDSKKNKNILPRKIEAKLQKALKLKKSVLLLGPRQTGKSTLLKNIQADLTLNFLLPRERLRLEKDPQLLLKDIAGIKNTKKQPLVILDEVQKVPALLDVVQYAIDENKARFILSGSSARKLKKGTQVNFLPGRVIFFNLDPLTNQEFPQSLENHLLFGSLPEPSLALLNFTDKQEYLLSYVETYLEEEVRQEALVRNLGSFARFLELAALESGQLVSYRQISNELGPTHATISSYYEVLQDCLIVHRVDPLTRSTTRKKLTKSSKFLFFDLGIRRVAAGEGVRLSQKRLGEIFEQFIGLELIRLSRVARSRFRLKFWRDHTGPEVDWVLDKEKEFIPIEVKWTDNPTIKDARHLVVFLEEYREAKKAFIVCQTPRSTQITKNIQAINWQDLALIF